MYKRTILHSECYQYLHNVYLILTNCFFQRPGAHVLIVAEKMAVTHHQLHGITSGCWHCARYSSIRCHTETSNKYRHSKRR